MLWFPSDYGSSLFYGILTYIKPLSTPLRKPFFTIHSSQLNQPSGYSLLKMKALSLVVLMLGPAAVLGALDAKAKAKGRYIGTAADPNTIGTSQIASIIRSDFGSLTPVWITMKSNGGFWGLYVTRKTPWNGMRLSVSYIGLFAEAVANKPSQSQLLAGVLILETPTSLWTSLNLMASRWEATHWVSWKVENRTTMD